MNHGLWICRRNYLESLMIKVSREFGGDDIKFLQKHLQETMNLYPDEKIEECIRCYEDIIHKLPVNKKRS